MTAAADNFDYAYWHVLMLAHLYGYGELINDQASVEEVREYSERLQRSDATIARLNAIGEDLPLRLVVNND